MHTRPYMHATPWAPHIHATGGNKQGRHGPLPPFSSLPSLPPGPTGVYLKKVVGRFALKVPRIFLLGGRWIRWGRGNLMVELCGVVWEGWESEDVLGGT